MFVQAIALTVFSPDPRSYQEAMRRPDAILWKDAMEKKSLENAKTYQIVDLPAGCRAIDSTTVFKTKQTHGGKIDKRK